jgi:hypothetical protein
MVFGDSFAIDVGKHRTLYNLKSSTEVEIIYCAYVMYVACLNKQFNTKRQSERRNVVRAAGAALTFSPLSHPSS